MIRLKKLGAAVGDSGGQMLVIGGANSADYARFSAITGVSNSLTGADGNTSDYNFITGAQNTLTNADSTYVIGSSNTVSDGTSNVVIGDKRKLTGTTNTVAIGSADKEMETTVSNATILGHNANATVADGVALGSNSVASVAKGVAGTVPTGATVSDTDKASATWTSTLGAVSVGDTANNLTRQITGVAAGTQATDAVNVAQLNAVNTVVNNHTTNISDLTTKVTTNTTSISDLSKTVDSNKIHFLHINPSSITEKDTNYNNDGAKGTNSIAIGKASTAANDSIIIGQGAISKSGKTDVYPIRSGDIAIGMGVKVNNYVNQGGGIAIGYNARSENMAGQQERLLALGQTEYTTGIAIGRNTYARSGSTMVGTHNYSGEIGDVTVNTTPDGMAQPNLNPFATTVGANSLSSGTMSTVMGAYSIATSDYKGLGGLNFSDTAKAPKNFGATIMGSLNSIESATSSNNRSGVANSIVGLANRAANSNGTLIFGAGNEVSNSITDITVPVYSAPGSAKGLQSYLIDSIKSSNSGGSTMVMGGGNKADYTQLSSILGVNNTLTGTSSDISTYNYISGFNNNASNVDNVTVIGRNRTVTGADSSIVIGKADSAVETTASDAVAIGRNTNVTVDGGVALGTSAIARTDKGIVGYDQSGKITDADSLPFDNAKYESLQTQISDTQTSIDTMTSEAASLQNNLNDLKSLFGDAAEQMEAYQGIQAQLAAKQNEIAEAQSSLTELQTEVGTVLNAKTTWQSTDAAVSVGDPTTGITRQITGVAAGTEDTDAVNVAQLKAAKVEVLAGDNTTVTSDNSEGYTKYTVAATDTKVTGLALDKNTLTLSQNGLDDLKVEGIATTTDLANNKVKYFAVNSTVTDNQDNTGAKGTNSIAIGPNAVAQRENGIALGTNVYSGGKGSIVIGSDAKVSENIALDGSIVIGKGAEAFTGGGQQEALLGMDPTNWPKRGSGGYDNPTDASRVATSIVIGTNAYGRTGSIDIGDRVYKGTMGGKEITDKNSSFHVNQTTLGTNTYNKGLFSTMVGSYSIATGGFTGDGGSNTAAYGAQNFGATVMGSLNSIRSNGSGSWISPSYQGIANTIVGLANITDNSNGSLVFGAGNKITNSITDISMPTSGADSVDAMVDKLQTTIKNSKSGGATLAIGGGNTADYTRTSSIIGVNNTLTGTSSNISQYNALTGYNNTATNVDNVTVTGSNNTVTDTTKAVVIGDNRTLTGVNNNVVIGSADSALETTVSDAVAIGRNANVMIEGGVALGANSVARTDKGFVGYDPSGRITDADSILGSNTQYQSLQTEVNDAQTTVNTLNSEAAVLQGYMDQIKQIDPNDYEQQEAYQAFKAQYDAKQTEITAAQADLDSKQSALAEAGKALYTWQSTAGSVSVGDVSKGITRQITDVAAGTADTDAVNVAQLKANKVTVAAGDNVTVTSTAADDGGTTYTVASKDTYTTKGTYDADSKKITFTQNDTEKNYEVDLSGLTDNIDKGLSFAGDSGDDINKQLGDTINIVGGATDVTTGNNIGVVSEDGKLNVRLAKDLTGLNSVAVGDAVTLDTTGLMITSGPSVTTTGIDAGNKTITNVANGVNDTDAVNVSQLNANKIHYFHVNSEANGTNYNNNGATGTDAIAIGTATAMPDNSVAIGNNARIFDSNGGKGSGDIAIGNGARINNYADQSASIAIGQNAQIDNMAGQQEALFSLGQTTFSGGLFSSSRIPADPSKVATGIAIGENTFVRSGGLMVGTHNYRGALGDVDVDSANTRGTGVNVNATTLGTNSYNNGAFSTITGAYSIASGNYAGGRNTTDAAKNFGATIMGSLNSVESATASSRYSGIANSIVGTANRTFNSNGSLIFGAGNEITNSVTTINAPTSAGDSAKALQDTLMSAIKDSASGGSTLAIGGGNKADYTLRTAIIGVNNTVTGTSSNISQQNYVTGYNNTGTNVDNVTIIGTNRTVSDAANSVVIGSADSVMTSSASDAVTIGRNANTTIDGGVALGSSSVASVDKGVAGYDVTTGKASTQTSATWKSTAAAVSVGNVANDITRQITGVAAGMQDTDAVNVAQLKQVAKAASDAGNTTLKFTGDDKTAEISRGNNDVLNITGGATATDADGNSLLTDNNIGVVKDGDNALNVQLAKNLTGLNSVAVGDKVTLDTTGLTIPNGPSVTTTGIDAGSKTITSVANGVNPTDAVNVSQLNANKVTVAAGTNVTVTPTAANDGSTTYTVAAKDTYTERGTYDANSKKITFVQNDTEKNYEVDLSALATSDEVASSATHYYSVNDRNYKAANYDNTGAKGGMSLAAGAGSIANGTASTVTGAFSRVDGDGVNGFRAFQGATAAVYGSFNVVGAQSGVEYDGVANSIIGVANKTENANAALVFGAGNKVTNSYRPVDMATALPLAEGLQKAIETGNTDDMITALGDMVKTSGGAVLAIGGANTADYAMLSKVVGVGNTLTGTEGNESRLNMIDGYLNTATNVNNVTTVGSFNKVSDTNSAILIGDNRVLTNASNSVILGPSSTVMTTAVADATAIGHNANVTVANGVALGSGSVASVDKDVAGYDVVTKEASTETSTAWKSTAAAVSVGDVANNVTRQITGVAAGMQDTDAVNVAQLKQVADAATEAGKTTLKFTGDDTSEDATIARSNGQTLNITGGATATDADGNSLLTDNNIGVVKEDDNALKVKLAKNLTGLNSVAVGDAVTLGTTGLTIKNGPSVTTTGIDAGSKTITNVANGVNPTDAVNVSQLNANKVTVAAGTNVTVTPTAANDGSTTYTVAAKDTYTESGTYDANSKKITFVQNDTEKNYEVDVSGLVDGINENIDKGLNFAGDSGDTINKQLDGTLDIVGGAKGDLTTGNIGVISEDGKLNVRLAKDLTGLNSVKVGDGVTLGTTGLTITNGPSVTTTGIDAGSKTITNVANGVNPTDAVNVSQLNANKVTVVEGTNVTVTPTAANDGSTTYTVAAKDTYTERGTYDANSKKITFVQNDTEKNYEVDVSGLVDGINENIDKGLNFAGDSGDTINKQLDGTLDIVGGAKGDLTTGNIGVISEDGKLNVRLAKDLTGLNSVKVGDGVTLGTTGLTITNGPSVTTTGIDAGSKTITNVANGVNPTDAVNVSQLNANKVTVAAGTNVTVTPTAANDGSTTYTVAAKDTYTESGTYDANSKKITFVQNDTEKNYEVDVSGLVDGINENIDKGLNFAGDSGDTINKQLDGTLDIVGGAKGDLTTGNIGVISEDGKLNVRLAKDLTGLNSVAVGDAVTLDTTGLTITNGPSVTTTGIDAGNKTITNVANGVNPTDAVNVSQLNANKVTVEAGDNVTVTPTTANDGSTTYKVASKDTYVDEVTFAGNTLTVTRNDKKSFEVKNIATIDDISNQVGDVALNFAGDDATDKVTTKNKGTLNITGGAASNNLTDDNIGVVKSGDDTLQVKLSKDLNGLNSVRVGGSKAGEGIYIANQSVNNSKGTAEEGNYITGMTNKTWDPTNKGYVSGRAATEDQLKSVYDTINSTVKANKVVEGKNITVTELADGAGTQVALKDDITLGDASGKNVAISGTNGTITAGDGGSNKVAIDGTNSTITAGTGDNKVTVDGNSGLVTVGDTTKGAISIGNQTVTPKVVGADGTETDGTAKTGKYITGLENTTWNPTGEGYVADRAATEGQLKNVADNISKQISDIDTAVKSTSRVFESDSGAAAQVTRKNTDPMKLKGGADANNLSDNNIGVVNNSDKTGFDIKLSKDIKGLNSIEVNNKITIGTGDNQTIIEGDTINTGSVTTGNTTINNEGLTIVNEDSSKNITINNNNVNMGGNVIKNIGEGSEPTDAINKTQFDRAINNLGTGMNQINNRVNKLDNRVNRVGAGAAALAALHPLEFSPDAKWEVTAGVGNYRGANAIALGAFYRPNFDTMFSIGTSYGGGENMINAGVTWRIGEGETKAYPSKTVMAQEIDDLKNVVSEQQDQIEELKKLVNSLINK